MFSLLGLAKPSRLKKLGIVGMNKRNVVYIAKNNPRKLYPLVDDKLKTKMLCHQHNIAVPKLLGVCRVQGHVRELDDFLSQHQQFVIKPAKGSGGKGILVITGRKGKYFQKASGELLGIHEIKRHVSNILSGLFSLGGRTDVAMIEALVEFTDTFEGLSFEGVPDIRVIIYRGYPVMAMTRLSTHASDGKANLHQGAVGVGIDIATGKALKAVQYDQPIQRHPDTNKDLTSLVIPDWPELLTLASRSYDVTGLGYIGADIVLDKQHGPLLLELNARPGLAIQMANGKGLEPRLKTAEKEANKGEQVVEKRVAFATQVIAGMWGF
ncbi:MAG: alpha-L-glutamate ligase-like protein [Pseudomonadales bacterium]|nr:alpha-L-glutamate ligase-like protein [Pseudomonadales bacterium]